MCVGLTVSWSFLLLWQVCTPVNLSYKYLIICAKYWVDFHRDQNCPLSDPPTVFPASIDAFFLYSVMSICVIRSDTTNQESDQHVTPDIWTLNIAAINYTVTWIYKIYWYCRAFFRAPPLSFPLTACYKNNSAWFYRIVQFLILGHFRHSRVLFIKILPFLIKIFTWHL